jgi:methylenetetrahydrofolate dehydrogenase (NADP+)/methenyltetrahydrofolate cyclohydrolase
MEKILDGKKFADTLNVELKSKLEQLLRTTKVRPKLITVLVGEDPASQIYINIKQKTCAIVGIDSQILKFEKNIPRTDLIKELENLNKDSSVHGILLQLPLPNALKDYSNEFINSISPEKDVDGLHPINKGKLFDYDEELAPCTPKGIISLLEHYKIELKGKNVVIVNRSLIIAVGHPNFLTKDKIKKGVIIIDVGINRINGKIVGDVNFQDVLEKCGKITPVPGGIGPLTVAQLMQNTFNAYKKQLNIM